MWNLIGQVTLFSHYKEEWTKVQRVQWLIQGHIQWCSGKAWTIVQFSDSHSDFLSLGILHQYQTLFSSHYHFSFSCKLYWGNIMIQLKSVRCVPTRVALQKVKRAGTKLTKDWVPVLVRERYSQMTISHSLVTSEKNCHGNSQFWKVMKLRGCYSRLKDLSVFWEPCDIWG